MKSLKLLVTNPSLFIKKVFGGPLRLYKIHILKDEFIIEMTRWKKNKGDKTHRLDYPTLTEQKRVIIPSDSLQDRIPLKRKRGVVLQGRTLTHPSIQESTSNVRKFHRKF